MNNPQGVKFCNEGVRVAADKILEAYDFLKSTCAVYDATDMNTILGDDLTALIEDGSDVDGRPRITVGGVKLTIANSKGILQQLETVNEAGISFIDGVRSISPRFR